MITKEAAIRERRERILSLFFSFLFFFFFVHSRLLSTIQSYKSFRMEEALAWIIQLHTQKCRLNYKRAKYLRETWSRERACRSIFRFNVY